MNRIQNLNLISEGQVTPAYIPDIPEGQTREVKIVYDTGTSPSLVAFGIAIHGLCFLIHEASNLLEHSPRRFVGNTEFPLKLFSRDTATSSGHQEHGIEPRPKRRRGFVEDSSRRGIYLVSTELASIGFSPCLTIVFSYLIADRTKNAIRVATLEYPVKASIIIGIRFVELFNRIFSSFHITSTFPIGNQVEFWSMISGHRMGHRDYQDCPCKPSCYKSSCHILNNQFSLCVQERMPFLILLTLIHHQSVSFQ